MSRLDDAIRSYDAEVEAEAVKLIEGGMPPFDAMEQARSNVRVRRMLKVRDDENANQSHHAEPRPGGDSVDGVVQPPNPI